MRPLLPSSACACDVQRAAGCVSASQLEARPLRLVLRGGDGGKTENGASFSLAGAIVKCLVW